MLLKFNCKSNIFILKLEVLGFIFLTGANDLCNSLKLHKSLTGYLLYDMIHLQLSNSVELRREGGRDMKLEDVVTVKVGRNISRVNENHELTLDTYTYENLIDDLNGLFLNAHTTDYCLNSSDKVNHLSKRGEVVFSFVSSKAAIVSDVTKGKIINQNFAKLIIEDKQLDYRYLCYILNESHEMKKQMAISMQGSTVRKLTPATLKSLDLKLPSMKKQQMIGRTYLDIKKRQDLARKQTELEEELYLEVLKQVDQS